MIIDIPWDKDKCEKESKAELAIVLKLLLKHEKLKRREGEESDTVAFHICY